MNKIRKDWKTITLTTLLALGGASLLNNHHAVHADVNTTPQTQHTAGATTNTKTAQDINPNTKIQIKPAVLNSLASNENKQASHQLPQAHSAQSKFNYTANNDAKPVSTVSQSASQGSNDISAEALLDILGGTAKSATPKSAVSASATKQSQKSATPKSATKSVAPKSVASSSAQSGKPKLTVSASAHPKSANNDSINDKIKALEAKVQAESAEDNNLNNEINQIDNNTQSIENTYPDEQTDGHVTFWDQASQSSAPAKTNAQTKRHAKPVKRQNNNRNQLKKRIKASATKLNRANQNISKFANKIHHQQRAIKYHHGNNKATQHQHHKVAKRINVNYHKLANAYDISAYQGYLSNSKARHLKKEVNFMILKAQGGNIEDPQIGHNEYEMKINHIPYGAYSYSYYSSPANARYEADELVRRAPKAKFYVNDCEGDYTYGTLNASTQAWANEMHRITKKPVILYSGAYFMGDKLNNRTRRAYNGLWLADYGYEPDPAYHYDLWQDADNFYSPALHEKVDADVFPTRYNKPLRFWTNGRK